MSLSCSCVDWDGEGWVYTYNLPLDFRLLATKRSKRCCSCKKLIRPGEDVVKLDRFRYPTTAIEERIYGEDGEVPLAPWYLCEECGGLFMAVHDLDLCWSAGDDIRRDIREWAEAQAYYRSKK